MWRLYLGITAMFAALITIGGIAYFAIVGTEHSMLFVRGGIAFVITAGIGLKLLREYREQKQIEEVNKLVAFTKGARMQRK